MRPGRTRDTRRRPSARRPFRSPVPAGRADRRVIRGGREIGRTSLVTAGTPSSAASVDRSTVTADHGDLVFVELELRDEQGVLHTAADRELTVSVEGAGTLIALGSGRPATLERYDTGRHTTFDGRALAVVRPTEAGSIRVIASADGLEETVVLVTAATPPRRRSARPLVSSAAPDAHGTSARRASSDDIRTSRRRRRRRALRSRSRGR